MLKSLYLPPSPTNSKYKSQHSFELRSTEAARIVSKYPDRIPIICEPNTQHANPNLPIIDKNKYLVPTDLTVGQFLYVIRKRLKMNHEQALYLFVNGTIPPTSELVQTIYNTHRDTDGFLYFTYNCENTFGYWGLAAPSKTPARANRAKTNRANRAEPSGLH